ncbi:MAG: GAF domain-containing protein, partial [Chloroflexota bacterium]
LMREHQKPVTILDVASSEQLEAQTRHTFEQAGIKSLMVLPMFDENNTLIGSVGLDFYTQQPSIDDSTVEAASAVVSQVALRLQKVNLLADSQRKAEQLEKLTEFGQQLRAYLSTEEILNTTLSIAPKAIDVDYIGILLYDRATNAIRNTATRFHDDVTIDLDATIINEETNSIALEAWTTHELVQADDLHLDWSWKHNLHRELQSIIAMPLTLAGVTLGVLEVGSVNPNHFDTQNVTTIRQISNQLAIALSNASAYAQSQRLAHNKSRANDIIAQLQQQLEVRDILNVTVNEIGKTLGAKKARIRLGTPPKTRGDE